MKVQLSTNYNQYRNFSNIKRNSCTSQNVSFNAKWKLVSDTAKEAMREIDQMNPESDGLMGRFLFNLGIRTGEVETRHIIRIKEILKAVLKMKEDVKTQQAENERIKKEIDEREAAITKKRTDVEQKQAELSKREAEIAEQQRAIDEDKSQIEAKMVAFCKVAQEQAQQEAAKAYEERNKALEQRTKLIEEREEALNSVETMLKKEEIAAIEVNLRTLYNIQNTGELNPGEQALNALALIGENIDKLKIDKNSNENMLPVMTVLDILRNNNGIVTNDNIQFLKKLFPLINKKIDIDVLSKMILIVQDENGNLDLEKAFSCTLLLCWQKVNYNEILKILAGKFKKLEDGDSTDKKYNTLVNQIVYIDNFSSKDNINKLEKLNISECSLSTLKSAYKKLLISEVGENNGFSGKISEIRDKIKKAIDEMETAQKQE